MSSLQILKHPSRTANCKAVWLLYWKSTSKSFSKIFFTTSVSWWSMASWRALIWRLFSRFSKPALELSTRKNTKQLTSYFGLKFGHLKCTDLFLKFKFFNIFVFWNQMLNHSSIQYSHAVKRFTGRWSDDNSFAFILLDFIRFICIGIENNYVLSDFFGQIQITINI